VYIYSRAKKLHIKTDVKRVAIIIETENNKDSNVLELMRTYFGNNSKDFITAVDENNVIVVKDLSEGDAGKEIDKAAKSAEAVSQTAALKGFSGSSRKWYGHCR